MNLSGFGLLKLSRIVGLTAYEQQARLFISHMANKFNTVVCMIERETRSLKVKQPVMAKVFVLFTDFKN